MCKGIKCGQVNRNHQNVKVEIIEGVNDFGTSYVFQRRTCEVCGEFLGDVFVEIKK